jgi:putative hydrolase of the HAD superfamily
MAAFVPPGRARELARAMAKAPFHADPDTVGLLRRVRDVMPLVIVTNATAGLRGELEAMGIGDLARHVVNSAWEGVAKPDAEIYRIASALAGVPPERCLFVDDRAENTAAAAALGMSTVRYRSVDDLRLALGPVLDAVGAGGPVAAGEISEACRRATARPTW